MDATITRPRAGLQQALTFGGHFLEMCISMCVAVAIGSVMLRGVQAAAPGIRAEWPLPTLAVMAIGLTIPMAAWMLVRGMRLRPILEMSAAGIVVALGAAAVGLVPAASVTLGAVCGIECVGMVGAMLFRLDLYTGHAGHGAHHAG